MNTYVEWATILSPIIAVLIAVVAWYLNYRSTCKHISALKDSTAEQIENIKKLAKLQAEIATLQMDKELWELRYQWRENSNQLWDALDESYSFNQHDTVLDKIQERREKRNNLSYKQDFYMKQMDSLKGHIQRFEDVKKQLKII